METDNSSLVTNRKAWWNKAPAVLFAPNAQHFTRRRGSSPDFTRKVSCRCPSETAISGLFLAFILFLSASVQAADAKHNASRIIQYRGPMPLLKKELWGTSVQLRFELYRSPDGGAPFWKETRSVNVGTNGWVTLDLGEIVRLPDEAFNTPFRFLSIGHGNVEFTPRKQVASLAYVSSTLEQRILPEDRATYIKSAASQAEAASALAPNREDRLDTLIDCGAITMEKHPRPPVNWLQAVETAARLGARLPTFSEWYGAYDSDARTNLVGMTGHYEWVIPWVYEPSIHSRLHELYRGKPVACYYEELSPMNKYPFRLLLEIPKAQ